MALETTRIINPPALTAGGPLNGGLVAPHEGLPRYCTCCTVLASVSEHVDYDRLSSYARVEQGEGPQASLPGHVASTRFRRGSMELIVNWTVHISESKDTLNNGWPTSEPEFRV